MKNKVLAIVTFFATIMCLSCNPESGTAVKNQMPEKIKMTKAELLNKIRGGWAGQVIGCTYGGPTEFRYLSKMIPDSVRLEWSDQSARFYFDNAPGLYDDIYMDLTFVDVFDKEGIDAPVISHAMAFANADYMLWHANQAARYNILNGIMPPQSGHWKYNMHADDIDFQIEADFAGLMSPGMANSATAICDRIGHIMNYGDGFYGGVYMAAMYSLAFVSDDLDFIIKEALKTIPAESKYHQAMQDVISFHDQYPDDWKKAWQAIEDSQWAIDLHCPDGIGSPFNIDASVNSAYVLLGLLYGEGDLEKTMEISTRAGQDSDCNPASAAGILCTMTGYDKIGEEWLAALAPVADIDFKYTTISLNDVYELGFDQALKIVERSGGKIRGESLTIRYQEPVPLPLEVAFPDIYPYRVTQAEPDEGGNPGQSALFSLTGSEPEVISFSGTGLIVRGSIGGKLQKEFVGELEVSIDGIVDRVVKLPVDFRTRTDELYWNIEIPQGDHTATLKWLNPQEDAGIEVRSYIEFTNTPPVELGYRTVK
ncbi:MAG: ADP-ribosylglycohydrolase family protein [Bacteroidales bacterium]